MDEDKIAGLSQAIKRMTREEAESIGKYVLERIEKIVRDFEEGKGKKDGT